MDEVTVAGDRHCGSACRPYSSPRAFISGISGQFYRQFALTIATATLISAFNSLTLSPALGERFCSRGHDRPGGHCIDSSSGNLALGWFFRLFNRSFGFRSSMSMSGLLRRTIRIRAHGTAAMYVVIGGTHRQDGSHWFQPASSRRRTRVTSSLSDAAFPTARLNAPIAWSSTSTLLRQIPGIARDHRLLRVSHNGANPNERRHHLLAARRP